MTCEFLCCGPVHAYKQYKVQYIIHCVSHHYGSRLKGLSIASQSDSSGKEFCGCDQLHAYTKVLTSVCSAEMLSMHNLLRKLPTQMAHSLVTLTNSILKLQFDLLICTHNCTQNCMNHVCGGAFKLNAWGSIKLYRSNPVVSCYNFLQGEESSIVLT